MHHRRASPWLPSVAFLAILAAPSLARAELRLAGFGGVEAGRNRTTAFTLRAEGTFGLLPWLRAGAYAASLHGSGDHGMSLGGMLALRPRLPLTPVDPVAWVSVGYQRSPIGNGTDAGLVVQAGLGLAIALGPVADLELRAGYSQLAGSRHDGPGFLGLLGVSFHT
ncbi:MAG: hypothetical protein HY909_27880 [Deltaproteobacteria bacterium]|nr:hypothetical protein [Deltaproteobacteria bacterium]